MPRLVPVLALLAACAAAGCRLAVPPLDAPDPAPALAASAGVDAQVEFRVESEADDAGVARAELPLAAALREALLHDPRIQQALARWRRARAASEEARLLPNPVLSLGVLLARALSDAVVTVGLTQEVAAYLERPHAARAADARLRAAAEEALAAAQDVVAETREAYLAAQAADARRASVEERIDLLGRLLAIHEEALRVGEGLPSDVTALAAERAGAELDLAELDADRARARVELARLVGRPSDEGAWTLDPWPALPAGAGDARAWIGGALDRRAEVRALGWEIAALGEEGARLAAWPWRGASAGIEAEYDEGFAIGPVADLALPLADASGPQRAALDAATAELRHRAVEARRAVIRDVRLALADETAARRALDLLERTVLPLVAKRREQIDAAKRAGEVEITILLLADRELADARARRVDLERRVLEARIRLERAAGGPGAAPFPAPGPHGDPR